MTLIYEIESKVKGSVRWGPDGTRYYYKLISGPEKLAAERKAHNDAMNAIRTQRAEETKDGSKNSPITKHTKTSST